jgi:hypothetical protein
MDDSQLPEAQLTLRGHDPRPAVLEVVYRSPRTRATKAILSLLGCWILGLVVVLIPPHIPWVIAAFVAGIYFSVRQWRGEYVVQRFQGECPRCGAALPLPPGSRIRFPHPMTCFQCHHEPVLEVR